MGVRGAGYDREPAEARNHADVGQAIEDARAREVLRNERVPEVQGGDAELCSAWSAAISYASGVLCETDPCFLDTAPSGKLVRGPDKVMYAPVVLRRVEVSLAKSASAYKERLRLEAESPTQPDCIDCSEPAT